MQRSLVAVVVTALTTIATFGSLAFIWAAPHPGKASQRPESDWRILDPVVYENIAIFPVVSGSSQDTSNFLTLEEGLAGDEVIVSERGATGMVRNRDGVRTSLDYTPSASVNQLVLINRSKRPLLLLAGELVSGGKQDRIIGKDRIVPAGAEPLPLDVFCVEHGRWTGASSQFTASKVIVHPSVREQAAVNQEQTEVWAAVAGGSTAAARLSAAVPSAPPARLSSNALADAIVSEAPTQSYRKIYEGRRVGGSVDSFVDQVQRRFARATANLKGQHVVGVVVAYGGEVAWSDIFASDELFHQYWSKLLRSYTVEALARPALRETASADDAREFLRRPNGREVQETEAGVYRWREITEGSLALIELDALQPKTMTLHRLLLHRTS
jgi:hypothetical protein